MLVIHKDIFTEIDNSMIYLERTQSDGKVIEGIMGIVDLEDYSYEDILGITFKLINSSDCYKYDDEYKIWKDKTENNDYPEILGVLIVAKGAGDMKVVSEITDAVSALLGISANKIRVLKMEA